MAQRVPPFTIRVKDGGRLIAGGSVDEVGAADYVEKTNWRRLDDAEVRREGTTLFRSNTGIPQGTQAFEAAAIVGMWEAIRPNGDRSLVLLTATTVYKYTHSTGTWASVGGPYTSSLLWQVESIDGYLIFNNGVDLLFTFRQEDSATVPMYELRDIGIACVGTICVNDNFLLVGDITEIQSASLNTWMGGLTPYGVVTANLTNRIKYKIVNSDVRDPTNWAPRIRGTIQSANKDRIVLDYPAPYSFPVGALLAVENAGADGATLGGQEGIEDGVAVTNVSGATITIDTPADSGLTYPLVVYVQRFADVSTFSKSYEIQDDSSGIIKLKTLKRHVMVYRDTGIFVGRFTGNVDTPFIFTPEYAGRNVPSYPRAVVDVNGDFHLYPSRGTFYKFDGAGEPVVHDVLHDARSLFYAGLDSTTASTVFALHNPITQEIWFFCPNGVLCYDYVQHTCSWIDQTYTAAAFVQKPGSSDYWFILARASQVLQYGATEAGASTYKRLGVAVTSKLKWGATSLGDNENEKEILGYKPLLASGSADVDTSVIISGKDSAAVAFDTLLTYALTTPATLPMIELFYRNVFFQDEFRVTETDDVNVTFTGRSFILNRIRSGGKTQNYNGNT